jgi:hypothetical protein
MLAIPFRTLISMFLVFTFILGSTPCFAVTKERLLQTLTEVEDFSHYAARPVQTASREEAFDTLKDHLRAMGQYHQEMAAMYSDHYTRYSNCKNPQFQKKLLDNFLKDTLGFDVPKETSPLKFISALSNIHETYSGFWLKNLAGLTGEVMNINGEIGKASQILQPNLENSKWITNVLYFMNLYPQLEKIRSNPEKYLNNKIGLMSIDELWALRHAHALILPWTKSDEEIQKELKSRADEALQKEQEELEGRAAEELKKKQAELERREKLRLKRERKTANKKAKKAQAKVVANSSPLLEETVTPELKQELFPEHTIQDHFLEVEENKGTAKNSVSNEQPKEKSEQTAEDFNYEAFEQSEKQKSMNKKQNTQIVNNNFTAERMAPLHQPLENRFQMDKDSYGYFMDLFGHKNLAFNDFVKAFENGLGGHMYKNKGGSIRTFQCGKYSFNLHKPHGKKGKAMFYDELRKRAIYNLGVLGVMKESLSLY